MKRFASTAVSTGVISQVTQFLNSQQKHNPTRQITITTLVDENYDNKDDDKNKTGHKVQNK
jgi:hypothetical protein